MVGRVTVDDEAATTAPVRLAALREHDAAAQDGASTRPDWLVVGAVAAGVAIVLALGAVVWSWSPVATANTPGPATTAAVPTAAVSQAPPVATSPVAPSPITPNPTVRATPRVRVPAVVQPAPQVATPPRPISGGTTNPPAVTTSQNGNGNGGNGNGNGGNGEREWRERQRRRPALPRRLLSSASLNRPPPSSGMGSSPPISLASFSPTGGRSRRPSRRPRTTS